MKNSIFTFYRILISFILRTKNIKLKRGVKLNLKTKFFGFNIIYEYSNICGAHVGYGTYVADNTYFIRTKIGNFCSIAPYSGIIAGSHPTQKWVSTHPCFFSRNKQAGFSFSEDEKFIELNFVDDKKQFLVEIGHDVWIGHSVKIMHGIKIGHGAIVAAGALVTKDVPPFSIVAGVPAKILKYRFSDEQIQKLLKIEWWKKDMKWLKNYSMYFDDIEKFLDVM